MGKSVLWTLMEKSVRFFGKKNITHIIMCMCTCKSVYIVYIKFVYMCTLKTCTILVKLNTGLAYCLL